MRSTTFIFAFASSVVALPLSQVQNSTVPASAVPSTPSASTPQTKSSSGGLPVVGDLLGGAVSGGLPIVGNLLGGSKGLPVVGNVLGKREASAQAGLGLPIVGDALKNVPVVGGLVGGGSSGTKLSVVGSLLDGNGIDLPVLGKTPILQNGKKAKREVYANAGFGLTKKQKRAAKTLDLPLVGDVLKDVPVTGSLLTGDGIDLPLLGKTPILQNGKN
jgi:hypothetical protein